MKTTRLKMYTMFAKDDAGHWQDTGDSFRVPSDDIATRSQGREDGYAQISYRLPRLPRGFRAIAAYKSPEGDTRILARHTGGGYI